MLKRIGVLVFITSLAAMAQAQGFTISGRVQDAETKGSLPGATVVLQKIGDTTFTQTAYTDTAGRFRFTNMAADFFRISISSVGYETVSRRVTVDSGDVDAGSITVGRSSKELAGVTVIAAAPPAVQKGDTVQFNASQFKVNPDASAEELARKIPGITIENGQVKANGEAVQRVTLDGRELFGDDATAALRNLPAEIIDKIQVFDRLSDQAQLSGFDDGNTQKGINIVTKANMRNGQFGRVYAGYGTDNRYQAGGNATLLKENRKISLVGNFNNTNQQNFSQQDLLGLTSNQRGGSGGGNRGNRGGGGNRGSGGGGNRGGGPGGQGGFGNNGNFLVGQQAGINKTNAAGINFSDIWGQKMTVSGSYFFNNSNNNTNEISNTEYFASSFTKTVDTTAANSNNFNHRVNMRMEYRIDSSNQLIISPNISFQDNETEKSTSRLALFDGTGINPLLQTNNINTTTSSRSGLNFNNSILFRHSFARRGRAFSINLNTSANNREGETYVTSFQQSVRSSGSIDTTTQRFTDQRNKGSQLSANLNYTEPLGVNSQLQFTYNPSISKSESDQEAFERNTSDGKYSVVLDSLSNQFENKTTAQNGGLSYRWGNRDRQISFGVNYQHTNLNSDQVFPRKLTVDKSFNNILPNAMVRYKLSPRSSIRLNYRANVNQPSVTQLQGVIDPTNAPVYTIGNPDLNQQYTHTASTQYTFTNTAKGLLLVGNVYLQKGSNYIANATFTPINDTTVNGEVLAPGAQLNKPVNLDGYSSIRSFLTFAVPIKAIKTNLNLNGGFTYSQLPGFTNYVQNETKNYIYTLGTVLASNISQFVDFTVSYSANFNEVQSTLKTAATTKYFSHQAGVQLNLLSKGGWFFQNDLNNQFYNGLTEGFNQNYFLWNMGVGKKFLKDNKGELRLNVFDLLKQNRSINREVTESYIEDVRNEVLQQYFMLTFTYNLRNFGSVPARNFSGQRGRQ